MRTQPPRLVHAVQRSVQLSVTSKVMQITVNGAVDWALDISAPHMMRTAFRAPAAARRLSDPGRRRSGACRATSGCLGARRHSVTPARSAPWPGARASAAIPSHVSHVGSWRAGDLVRGLWGSIVMPLSSPRYIPGADPWREPARRPGQEDVGGLLVAVAAGVTSSSCASCTPFSSWGRDRGHQFQFRIRVLLPIPDSIAADGPSGGASPDRCPVCHCAAQRAPSVPDARRVHFDSPAPARSPTGA